MGDLLKAIAHPTRLQILDELRKGTQSISQYLTLLRNAKLVDFARDGALRCYCLSRPKPVEGVLDLSAANPHARNSSHSDTRRITT